MKNVRISKHYQEDRKEREAIVKMLGVGKVVDSFVIDRGHMNGPEIHELTSTGIINIYNERTHKLITKLIAQPYQIRRYYPYGKAPKFLIKKAIDNTVKHDYNNR